MENHLDQVFMKGAARLSECIAGKKCNYRLDAMGYTVKSDKNGQTGTCEILGVTYSRNLDCDVYHLRDTATGEMLNICQFEVWLEDI